MFVVLEIQVVKAPRDALVLSPCRTAPPALLADGDGVVPFRLRGNWAAAAVCCSLWLLCWPLVLRRCGGIGGTASLRRALVVVVLVVVEIRKVFVAGIVFAAAQEIVRFFVVVFVFVVVVLARRLKLAAKFELGFG